MIAACSAFLHSGSDAAAFGAALKKSIKRLQIYIKARYKNAVVAEVGLLAGKKGKSDGFCIACGGALCHKHAVFQAAA